MLLLIPGLFVGITMVWGFCFYNEDKEQSHKYLQGGGKK